MCERRNAQPLLRIDRLRDRAVGGGLLLCLVNAGLMFGLFLLCSLYLQLALGHGPLPTGLAFIPLALAAGSGAHVAGQLLNRHGLRWSAGPALALAAGGLLLLSHIPAHGSYLRDMLPGMLMAGFGLGLSGTAMAVGVLTGVRHEEAGMLSGASATTHEIGGTLGIAIYASIATAASGGIFVGPAAAAGIAHAFLIAAYVALIASVATLVVLPAAKTFLPKLRLAPAMPMHRTPDSTWHERAATPSTPPAPTPTTERFDHTERRPKCTQPNSHFRPPHNPDARPGSLRSPVLARCKSQQRCSSDLPWRLVVWKAISDSKEVGG